METEPTDRIKGQLGRIAILAWLGGGILLFLTDGGFRALLSLNALLFLAVGMFVATILVGLASYRLFLWQAGRLSANDVAHSKQALGRLYRQSQAIAGVLGLLFVLWVYASFFWA